MAARHRGEAKALDGVKESHMNNDVLFLCVAAVYFSDFNVPTLAMLTSTISLARSGNDGYSFVKFDSFYITRIA